MTGAGQGGRYLVTGGSGFLGAYLLERLARGARVEVLALGRRPPRALFDNVRHLAVELDAPGASEAVRGFAPDVVLHLAALTDPDGCERDPRRAERVNETASDVLARAAAPSCRRMVYVSTDLVFDGCRRDYGESDEPRPLSVYGRTKLEGERAVASALGERAVVARLALLYGRRRGEGERRTFADVMIERARSGEPVPLFTDQFRTPLHAEDAAASLVALARRPSVPPLVHLGGRERVSRFDMGRIAFESLALPPELLVPRVMADVAVLAPRPEDVSLDTALARSLELPARSLHEGFLDWARPDDVSGERRS